MNTNLLPIAQYVQQCAVDICAVSIAAGMAVARFANLPGGEVESINMHYVSQAEELVNQLLSEINENMPLNLDKATKVARSAYLVRYCAAYPKTDGSVVLPSEGNFFEKYLSINIYFDKEIKCYTDNNAEMLVNLVNRFLVALPSLVK
jgi:hypothetical protein